MKSLNKECIKREYNVTYFGNCWDNLPRELMNDYQATKRYIKWNIIKLQ